MNKNSNLSDTAPRKNAPSNEKSLASELLDLEGFRDKVQKISRDSLRTFSAEELTYFAYGFASHQKLLGGKKRKSEIASLWTTEPDSNTQSFSRLWEQQALKEADSFSSKFVALSIYSITTLGLTLPKGLLNKLYAAAEKDLDKATDLDLVLLLQHANKHHYAPASSFIKKYKEAVFGNAHYSGAIETFDERSISESLHAFRAIESLLKKTKKIAFTDKILDQKEAETFARRINEGIKDFSPFSLTRTALGLPVLRGLIPEKEYYTILKTVFSEATHKMAGFSGLDFVEMAEGASANHYLPDDAFLDNFFHYSKKILPTPKGSNPSAFRFWDLRSFFYSIAALNKLSIDKKHRPLNIPNGYLDAAFNAARPFLPDMERAHLPEIAFSANRLGYTPTQDVMNSLCDASTQYLDTFTGKETGKLLWAFTGIGFWRNAAFFDKFYPRYTKRIPSFLHEETAEIISCLGKLNENPPEAFKKICFDILEASLENESAETISKALFARGAFNYAPSDETIDRYDRIIAERASEFTFRQSSHVLQAHADLRIMPSEEMTNNLFACLTPKLKIARMEDVANVLRASTTLGLDIPKDFLDAFGSALLDKKHEALSKNFTVYDKINSLLSLAVCDAFAELPESASDVALKLIDEINPNGLSRKQQFDYTHACLQLSPDDANKDSLPRLYGNLTWIDEPSLLWSNQFRGFPSSLKTALGDLTSDKTIAMPISNRLSSGPSQEEDLNYLKSGYGRTIALSEKTVFLVADDSHDTIRDPRTGALSYKGNCILTSGLFAIENPDVILVRIRAEEAKALYAAIKEETKSQNQHEASRDRGLFPGNRFVRRAFKDSQGSPRRRISGVHVDLEKSFEEKMNGLAKGSAYRLNFRDGKIMTLPFVSFETYEESNRPTFDPSQKAGAKASYENDH